LGAGAGVQQSLSYNFSHGNVSTSTTAFAYASFGPATIGGSVSSNYDISNSRWSNSWGVNAGVGIGNINDGLGVGISYGSNGWGYGMGGYHRTKKVGHYFTAGTNPPDVSGDTEVDYTTDELRKVANDEYGHLPYRKKAWLLAESPDSYSNGVIIDGAEMGKPGYFYNVETGEFLYGATYPGLIKRGRMFMAKAAFGTYNRLKFSLGHEFIHLGFARHLNLPDDHGKHHASILKWEESMYNTLGEVGKSWINYHRSIYKSPYDPRYDLCAVGFCID